jgi:dihydroxyacetone kinase phosphoprotein-dependent L subunit
MAGCSLTVFWLDDELEELWVAPADTPAFRRGQVTEAAGGASSGRARQAATAREGAERASAESVAAAGAVRAVLEAMQAAVVREEQELGRLDSVAGDGDHGAGMVRGFRAATEAARDGERGAGSVLRAAGAAFADKAGGTSGALWGVMLDAAGSELGDSAAPMPERVAAAVRRAAEAAQRVGHANRGDKTLLDALLPFADALEAGVGDGAALPDAWTAAARAAEESAQQTAELVARIGRARPLGERSVGTPDPGAVSMALCLTAAGDPLATDCAGA